MNLLGLFLLSSENRADVGLNKAGEVSDRLGELGPGPRTRCGW